MFALVLGTTLDVAASLDPRRARELDFSGHGAGLAIMLFLARRDGFPVAEASEVIRNAAVDELASAQAAKAWQSWVRAHGDPAEPAWRDALGRVELRGYAKATLAMLATRGDGDPATATPPGFELADDDLAWMLTDALAADGWDEVDDDDEPEALAERLREAIPPGRELAAFEMMARVPHPDAGCVLTVIGRYHPDKRIAKMARKSAYKAASRRAARHG